MRITGAASSNARAVVSSPDHLTVELDADGNGVFEKTFPEVDVSTL